MRWSASTLPIVDAGVQPPRGARIVPLLWPCWALPCELQERVAAPRTLDLFEEAVLGLSAAGLRAIGEMATTLGLHRDLIAFITRSLIEQRLLDEAIAITATGRAFLERQLDETVMARTTGGYCVVDAVTGVIWRRWLERFEGDASAVPDTVRVPPAGRFAGAVPEHTTAEVLRAVRRARKFAGVVGAIERVLPSWSASEPCFVRTYAYRRSLDTRQDGVTGWTVDSAGCVADPFGSVLRDEGLTDLLRASSEPWAEGVLERLTPVDDDSEAAIVFAATRRTVEAELRSRLPVLARRPRLLDELGKAHAMLRIAEPESACTSMVTVLHGVFRESLEQRPAEAAVARFPERRGAAMAHARIALDECGFVPEIPDGILDGFREGGRSSMRGDGLRVVLAAADDKTHPLRVLAARDASAEGCSRWMLDLVPLARARNLAVHESGPTLGSAAGPSLQRYMSMTEAAIEHLLEAEDEER